MALSASAPSPRMPMARAANCKGSGAELTLGANARKVRLFGLLLANCVPVPLLLKLLDGVAAGEDVERLLGRRRVCGDEAGYAECGDGACG